MPEKRMTKSNHKSKQSGFTLIEILLVVSIVAVLAIVIIVAVKPGA